MTDNTSSWKSLAEITAGPDVATATVLQAPVIKQLLLQQQVIPVPGVQHSVVKNHMKATEQLFTADILGDVDMKTSTCTESNRDYTAENITLGAPLRTIKLTDKTGEWGLIGIAPIYKTMICVAHSHEENILVYSTEGQLKRKIQIPGISTMFGLVATNSNEGKLAIVDYTAKVHFVTLSQGLEVLQHTTKDVSGTPQRLSIGNNKQLIVSNGHQNKLSMLNADGQVLCNIQTEIPLDKEVYLTATQTNLGFVFCDQLSDKVYFTDVKGHILRTCTCFVRPQRAVHTSCGHVLIADYNRDAIKVFDGTVEFLGDLPDNSGSFPCAHYLHIDETKRLLYMACGYNNTFELRMYKFALSDLPSLPVKRTITNLEVTVNLATA